MTTQIGGHGETLTWAPDHVVDLVHAGARELELSPDDAEQAALTGRIAIKDVVVVMSMSLDDTALVMSMDLGDGPLETPQRRRTALEHSLLLTLAGLCIGHDLKHAVLNLRWHIGSGTPREFASALGNFLVLGTILRTRGMEALASAISASTTMKVRS